LRPTLFRRRRLGTSLLLGVALATFAALAVTSHGFPVQQVSLNDGGIWVTDNASGYVARFDRPIAQLDGFVEPGSGSGSVNVWQDGSVIAAYGGGRIYAVNPLQPNFYDPAGQAISPAADGIALGGTTLAVLSTDHALRAVTLGTGGGSLSALSAAAKPLAAQLPANAAVAVGSDGTIWVAGGGELRAFPGGAGAPTVSTLPLSASDPMQVTTVGDVPVVADAATGTLYLPESGRPAVQLPGAGAASGFVLQQPSGAGDVVLAATDQTLYSVTLSNGQLSMLSTGHSGTAVAPVQVAGCVDAAWAYGATGSYVHTCGTPPPATSDAQTFQLDDSASVPSLVFRVNNDSVVLNDTTDGRVFFLEGATLTSVEPDWQPNSTPGQGKKQGQTTTAQQKDQLVANPVTQGVRPGTTTVVHVLDNARDNPGATIVVSALGNVDQPGVHVAISPDAQTVLATVTTMSTDAHFQYTIDDGRQTASSEVTLVPVSPAQNFPPMLRPDYQAPALQVAAGESLVVPVIGDWRDFDGDPLFIEPSSVVASSGSATVTASGALSFTAPLTSADKSVTVRYGVSDGRVAKPSMTALRISVLGSKSTRFVAPVAEPDAALAVVGAPVTLQPLDVDLPGVDPTNPSARLTLAAPVPAVAGAAVATDLTTGAVTFTAQHPGNFFLSYTAAYGAAPTAAGTIRVYVQPATGIPKPPVTSPAVAVLHGQQPAVVDVLANDYDPQGWILGVTGASAADPGVHVTVIDQRWLRVSADDLAPGSAATVDYTVSDGQGSATGTVAVSALPAAPDSDQITTSQAEVTVQAGDTVAVPVLAGDSSSTGLPLSIDGLPPTANPAVAGLRLGVQGSDIRIVAPAAVTAEEETTVSYVATDADGTTADGGIDVTIMPAPSKAHPDQAPQPQEVDARETAGDVVVIPIPVDGVDPDGDSVTVTGVTTAPTLGRIVAIGPDSITYQSYPGSLGTDTFGYQVTDQWGLTGTAQVRVAVLPPGLPQPPVAVDDVINAPPGASLHWNLLANDFIAPGDSAVIEPLSKTNTTVPAGVRLTGSYVYLTGPAAPSDPPVEFTYGLTDGSTPSLAQVIVHAVPGAKLPPIANDAVVAQPAPGATTVTVNVLKDDDDPVGSPSDLTISWAPAGVAVHGPDLTIKLTAHPRQVPYEIAAPDGLTATAVVYVPGTYVPRIRLRPGALITVKQNGVKTVPLSSVLTDTAGRQLKITTVAQLAASPAADVAVSANQATEFQVHALGGYAGPGAVTVQVYDGATLQDPTGETETLTIPVQVGSGAPVLRCTADPLGVVEGGAPLTYDISQLCQLWAGAGVAPSEPRYTVAWARPVAEVSAGAPGGSSLQLTAGSGAAPGATGTLTVTPAGATAGGTLNVAVITAPLPAGNPVSVTVKAGQSVTVNLSQYVTSPLARPDIQVLGVTRAAGLTVAENGPTVTISAAQNAAGTIGLVATVTDVAGRADREIGVPVTVNVIGDGAGPGHSGVPGAPGAPSATASGQAIVVSFASAAANGAPVEFYTVYTNGAPHQCAASPCTITGLANGTRYTVYVTATNSVGEGPRSATTTVPLNAVPGRVAGLTATAGAGQVTLTWQPVSSPVTGYQVEISPPPAGQPQIAAAGRATARTFTGLADGTTYTFTVLAVDAAGNGPWSLGVTATPFGKPATMAAPTATGAAVPDPAATRAITVSWAPAQDNGSPVTGYTVYEYQAAADAGPWNQVGAQTVNGGTSTSFTVNNNNSWYEYAVTATNEAGTSARSPLSTPAVQAAAPPDAPTGLTAAAQNDAVQIKFTAGAANSAQVSTIEYGIDGAAADGTIAGPFTAGTAYTEIITNAMSAGIVNGTPVTIYIAECNNADLCSTWTGPSAQVTPRGPAPAPSPTPTAPAPGPTTPAPGPTTPAPGPTTPAPGPTSPAPGPTTQTPAPTASATLEAPTIIPDALPPGNDVEYFVDGIGDGLPQTMNVCADGTCTPYPEAAVKAGKEYTQLGSFTGNYNTTYTITAYVTDSSGQRAPATGSVSATVTTSAPPPTTPTVTLYIVSDGLATSYSLTATNFLPNTVLTYTCSPASDTGPYTGPETNSAGTATWEATCGGATLPGPVETFTVTDGTNTASASS